MQNSLDDCAELSLRWVHTFLGLVQLGDLGSLLFYFNCIPIFMYMPSSVSYLVLCVSYVGLFVFVLFSGHINHFVL